MEIIKELKCPKCDGKDFLAGPRGGVSQNIACKKCGYGLNVVPLTKGEYLAEEIGYVIQPSRGG